MDRLEEYTNQLDEIFNLLANPPNVDELLSCVCKRNLYDDFTLLCRMEKEGAEGAEGNIEKVKDKYTGKVFAAKTLNKNDKIIQKKLCVGEDASIYI